MSIICEHESLEKAHFEKFNPTVWSDEYRQGMLLNPAEDEYHKKYFFEWNSFGATPCYTASYCIGAQRIGDEELIIKPKMDNLDFMKMFNVCLNSNLDTKEFSRIYGIDLNAEPIKTESNVFSAITPLIVVHFIMLMKKITSKGLRNDYIRKNENLGKLRGRIDISNNERKNVIVKRYDRIYCKYEERSVNTPENRLFKRALLFSKDFVYKMRENDAYKELMLQLNVSLSAFAGVSDKIEAWEVKNTKKSNLYQDYDEAIKLAKVILRFFDNSISTVTKKENKTPVFWIDMALLYEHYVYGLLYNSYGNQISYQNSGLFGWRPDFLHKTQKIIMDTKYMPCLDGRKTVDEEIVRQLSGYARAESFIKKLGLDEESVIPCLVLYPTVKPESKPYVFNTDKPLLEQATRAKYLNKFYKLPVPMPALKL